MARIVWVAVGAAAGVWAYKRGEQALARARERSTLENLQTASQTATRVAATGARVVAAAGAQGAKVAARLAPATDGGHEAAAPELPSPRPRADGAEPESQAGPPSASGAHR